MPRYKAKNGSSISSDRPTKQDLEIQECNSWNEGKVIRDVGHTSFLIRFGVLVPATGGRAKNIGS